jgi:hypothetical protein
VNDVLLATAAWNNGGPEARLRLLIKASTRDNEGDLSSIDLAGELGLKNWIEEFRVADTVDHSSLTVIAVSRVFRDFYVTKDTLWKAIALDKGPPRRREPWRDDDALWRLGDAKAAKHDGGKPRWTLLPMRALQKVIDVLEFGAKKHEHNDWKCVEREYHLNAAFRHMAAVADGEKLDPETGLPHAAHAACRILFVLYFDGEKP